MTQEAPVRDPLLELSDALARHQLRQAGAEVAAAIAHAVGTPLNVISGRAELIRHDPSNALAQVARIEEQVKKLANGLRQVVDYLAVPDPISPGKAAPPAASAAPQPPLAEIVEAKAVLDDLSALAGPLASSANVGLVVTSDGLAGGRVERWNALGTLNALVSCALRQAASMSNGATEGKARGPSAAEVRVSGSIASQGVLFDVAVPGLTLIEGWQLENFPVRPSLADCPEFYRTVSICGAVVRGHGGRLLLEATPGGEGVTVRFSCRNEAVTSA
jgi:hypothetical protein